MKLHQIAFYFTLFLCARYSQGAAIDDETEELEGYYWRHYTDHVPKDALPGGKDMKGETTYIGQALYRSILIPGQFIVGDRKLYFEWGDAERVTSDNIKILCTKHPEQFEWIRTTTEAVGNIPDKNFILGGFESDFTVYIGRVAIDNTLAIGKVIFSTHESSSVGFHTTCRQNASFVRAQEFEVLNYEPKIPPPAKMEEKAKGGAMFTSKIDAFCFGLMISVILFLTH
ncbi:hypothetical protein RI129_009698 [Pyrocoelia pectoralis]|uniref:Uncharacterized protein n=1 Tax=Pyrocoelia pectoralis TaxID=417401 RepID=A0AAN7ZIH4_9COLE